MHFKTFVNSNGFVRYESTRLHGYAQVVEMKNITIHERFNRTTKDNDIALVQTQPMNLTIAHPITLPEQGKTLMYDELLNISGFGYNGNNPPYQENLQLADVTKFDQELCLEYYPSMTTNMFCCGSPLGEVDFCRGDNGGPGTNRGILYGIPSWHQVMNICGGGTNGGIYTDVTQYVTWIKSIVPDL